MIMNIEGIKDCFGCGVCAAVCSRKVINIELNENGFYEPKIINNSCCTDCGLCVSVCAYSNTESLQNPILKSYAARSKSHHIEQTSTSGGVSYEIGLAAISKGYKFCGAIYDANSNDVHHIVTDTAEGVKLTQGSKYIQSYTVDAFRLLNRKEKNIVVGTPCQIASLRRYIKKFKCQDNFILIDFFCHGVPSRLMWNKYFKEHSTNLGSIKNITWRNKLRGWRAGYCISIEGSSKIYRSYNWDGDDFYTYFLGDACLGKACYDKCRFKYDNSAADIRIGDLWGETTKDETNGTCAVVCFSSKGVDVVESLDLDIEAIAFSKCAGGQMHNNPQRPWYYKLAQINITSRRIPLKWTALIIRMYKKIKRQLNKINKKD